MPEHSDQETIPAASAEREERPPASSEPREATPAEVAVLQGAVGDMEIVGKPVVQRLPPGTPIAEGFTLTEEPIGVSTSVSKVTFEEAAAAMAAGIPLAATVCSFLAFDTETSGLFDFKLDADHPSQPYLAQASMIFLDADMVELDRFTGLVKPDGWVMAPGATAVNGLTTDLLMQKGRPVGQILDIYEAAMRAGAVACAHNAQYDCKVMRGALRRAGRPDLFRETNQFCTMRAYAKHAGVKWPKLADLCRAFGIENRSAHSADADAEVVAKLLPLMRDLGIEIAGRVYESKRPEFAHKRLQDNA